MAISPMEEKMMRALAYYKNLTVSHIITLGISISKDKSRSCFRALQKEKLIDRYIHYSAKENAQKKGNIYRRREEYLWYLTVTGAKFLDSYTELSLPDICFPKRPKQYLKNDYFHRVSTVFIHIAFDKWLIKIWAEPIKTLQYFGQRKESKERRFESATRIALKDNTHFTPDSFYSYVTASGEQFVLCLEVQNGSKKYIVDQTEKLFWIIDTTKKIEKRVGVESVPRVLCTCNSEKLLKDVLKEVRKRKIFQVERIDELVFFNLDRNVRDNFWKGWLNIVGEECDLEDIKPFDVGM